MEREREKKTISTSLPQRCVPWILNHGNFQIPSARIVRVSSSQLLRSRSKKSHETSSYSATPPVLGYSSARFLDQPFVSLLFDCCTRFAPHRPDDNYSARSSNLNQITQSNSQTISLESTCSLPLMLRFLLSNGRWDGQTTTIGHSK